MIAVDSRTCNVVSAQSNAAESGTSESLVFGKMNLIPQRNKNTAIFDGVTPLAPEERSLDDDAIYVSRSKAGDTIAFGQLVTRHERKVRSIVSRIVYGGSSLGRDAALDLDDIVQDVFVQSWKAINRFRGESRFSTWLYRIAANTALKEWKKQKGRGAVLRDDYQSELKNEIPARDNLSPQKVFANRLREDEMGNAIDALPEKQRIVILLHYYEDCPCDEIAVMLSCSIGTVWSRLHYAVKRLREHLDWLAETEGLWQ
jgi:RNA polymerase sigma-70 factor (ECF subfamily)